MDGLLKILAAVVAALNAATGAPLDVNSLPDRPPIMLPTLAPLPTLPSNSAMPANDVAAREAISGTITNLQEGFVFVNGVPVLLGPTTKVNGELRVGLDVQVQAKLRSDGILEANELDLNDKSDSSPAIAEPALQTSKNTAGEPVATPTLIQEAKPVGPESMPTGVKPQTRERPEVNPTEQAAAQPTGKAQVEPTEQPTAQSSGKTQVEPTAQPTPQPTTRSSNDGGKTAQNGTESQTSGKTSDSGTTQNSTRDSGDSELPGD